MMKTFRFLNLFSAGFAILAATCLFAKPSADAQEAARPFSRVLFLGNSITKHGPKESIGWSGNWGMAASEEAKDYVHLVTSGLSDMGTGPFETMVRNIAGFERNYASYDLDPLTKEIRLFNPDLVILAIGENVPKLETAKAKTQFAERITTFLKGLQFKGNPRIVVRSSFWANEAKDQILRQVCDGVGGTYVDIGHLGKDESNYAKSEREFTHDGVAAHPGDKGMQEIADAILTEVQQLEPKQDE